jgi:hypothetical protein
MRNAKSLSIFLLLLIAPQFSIAFDNKAHEALSIRAVESQDSNIDRFLKEVLGGNGPSYAIVDNFYSDQWYCPNIGQTSPCAYQLQFIEFPTGINQVIGGTRVRDLIRDGALNEDKGVRVRHHFHDPTLPWDRAGLRPPPLFVQAGQSSIIWGQNPSIFTGGGHSWQNARDSYFIALTSSSRVVREMWWSETLRNLGHQIHLAQDAAAPSHTRNDTHLWVDALGQIQQFLFPIFQHDEFHVWADSTEGLAAINAAVSRPFDTSILNRTPNPLAPVPIARIIDSTDTIDPFPSAGTDRGLAEYSNTYFFSDDTIFQNYPYPDSNALHLGGPEFSPEIDLFRRYLYFNNPTPDTNHRLAVATKLMPLVTTPIKNQQWELDHMVFRDYGQKLFPRAIGYSAGLIEYFFRGKMALDTGCDGCNPFGGLCPAPFCGDVTMLSVPGLKNSSDVGEDATGPGTVWAVWPTWATPRVRDPQTGFFVPPVPGGDVIFHLSDPLPITLARDPTQPLTFTFSNHPPPLITETQNPWLCVSGGKVPCDLHLIYRGPLGGETDAIIVLRTPLDID